MIIIIIIISIIIIIIISIIIIIKIIKIKMLLQSNLPIADMLYNGHLVIVNTFLRNRLNHGQTLVEKPLYSGQFYSRNVL